MATGTLVPLREYLDTAWDPDREFVDGEVLERNAGESDHSGLQSIIAALLYAQRRLLGIHIFTELRVQIAATRFRIPDVAVTTTRIKGKVLHEPPCLCVEILSPEDRASRMEQKIEDYLKFGVRHVWIVDPRLRTATAYTRDSRHVGDVLTTSDPRIELRLAGLFRALDADVETDPPS